MSVDARTLYNEHYRLERLYGDACIHNDPRVRAMAESIGRDIFSRKANADRRDWEIMRAASNSRTSYLLGNLEPPTLRRRLKAFQSSGHTFYNGRFANWNNRDAFFSGKPRVDSVKIKYLYKLS